MMFHNPSWVYYKSNMSHLHIMKGQESLPMVPSLQKTPNPEATEE